MMKTVSFVMGGIVRRELLDSPAAGDEVAALPPAAGVPTIVLSSTRAAMGESPAFRSLQAQLQDEIAASYATRRHQRVADSGHYIQRDQPRAVIAAARELAECDLGQ
jgi:pimeloyl-ACP methyl ester carboxylesterase